MNLKIEVLSEEVREFSGTSRKTGNDYHIRKQIGWLHQSDKPYPSEIEINLEKGQVPYRKGVYQLHPSSFYVDANKRLSVKPVLLPAAVAETTAPPEKKAAQG